MIIRTRSYARVGLIGNPSDGYFGKTMSFTFGNYHADVTLYESPELEIVPSNKDHSTFREIGDLVKDVNIHGYYGGIRLLKATVKRFCDYCQDCHIDLHGKNFTLRYSSNIPHGLGLAGSSAIINAAMRALQAFYGVSIPKYTQANLILSAETDELGIAAGLQDRVVQVYEGLVYMDFDQATMETQGYGRYVELDPKLLPPLYVAYCDVGEPTEIFHSNLRGRFNRGEKEVVDAMAYWADLTDQARAALEAGKGEKLGKLLNANYDKRASLYTLNPEHVRLVETARSVGATAKFTGSGGAIVGTYESDAMYKKLKKALQKIKAHLIKPRLVGGAFKRK